MSSLRFPIVPFPRAVIAVVAAIGALGAGGGAAEAARGGQHAWGVLELETRSAYSLIRVRRQGNLRTLVFVRDNGEEVDETIVNLKKPYQMMAAYAPCMFASYLLQPQQARVLIVGLGGGAMVHFLKHYDADLRIDVVEIDPAVVKIADVYFGIRSAGKVNVVTGDGLEYLEKTEHRYDVIYMDAYLKPAANTDTTGLPLRLKTEQFYRGLQEKLRPGGVVAFNLNRHKGTEADLDAIGGAFREVYVFRPAVGNVVALATARGPHLPPADLHARAREADRRFKATFSFQELLRLGR
jgi:spermidine synthase